MYAGEVFLIIFFNSLIFAGFYFAYTRIMERRLRHLKSEVQELEDLVAAIIEEFEEVAALNEKQSGLESEIIGTPEKEQDLRDIDFNGHLAAILADSSVEPPVEASPSIKLKDGESPDRGSHPTDPRHRRMVELWKNGIPVEEIARQLGTGRGEVQLVLGLHQKM